MTTPSHMLVIGGSKGIGRAVVRSLAEDGHTVSVVGRSKALEQSSAVRSWTADVSDPAALQVVLDEIVAAHGAVSGVVLLQRFRGEGDDWFGEMATSLTATRNVLEWLAEHHHESGASVVVIGSAAASFVASEQPVSYHVAKAGVVQMVRYYAVALGAKGVRLNSISPGTIVKEESQAFYAEHPALERLYQDVIPVGRMGTAQDVADLALFLLSDRASFLTGQDILLDGGVSLHWQEALARRLSPLKDLNVSRQPRRKQ